MRFSMETLVIEQTKAFVKNRLKGQEVGHDWHHVERVWLNGLKIAQKEECNLLVVQLASLLHDIADWKFHDGNERIGSDIARTWLSELKLDEMMIDHICDIILTMSFKGAHTASKMATIEGQIVQDADRLDAIGAIGIARAFSYGAYTKQELYNEQINLHFHSSFEEYKNAQTTTINHFYEKLFLLKERMNTKTGKKMAEERHRYMVHYIQTLKEECQLDWLPDPNNYTID